MTTRRERIHNIIGERFVSKNANASLWLDKFIFNSEDKGKSEASFLNDTDKKDETAKNALVNQVTSISEPEVYIKYLHQTWIPSLQKFGAKPQRAKVKNRLAINLGTESVLETNIALHRLFGVPFIPGSAIKGVVSHFLDNYGGSEWNKQSENHKIIFGNQDEAGFVTFHDALLYVQEKGFSGQSLYKDVLTPHHSDYYRPKNTTDPPADWDNPTPIPFISATGEFLLALSGPADWVELTLKILEYSLDVEGIGAKTSSGYGRMYFVGGPILSEEEKLEKQKAFAEGIISEMTVLLSSDKEIKKEFTKRLNKATKKLNKNDPADASFAKKLAKEAVRLDLKDKLIENKPTWFQNVVKIIPLNDSAVWIVESKK